MQRVCSAKGYAVFGADKEVEDRNFQFIDITQKDTVGEAMQNIQPDIVVLTAALSHVDYCEEFPEESEKVNIHGLQNVLDALDKEKTKMIFFSSDYIFDGEKGPYGEDDQPNPLCVYGKHKLMGEEMIRNALKNYLIVRTNGVYGPEQKGKNFVLSLLKKLKGGEKVNVPFDQIGSPTYSENLAEVVEELVQKEKQGVYNIAGPELADRYSFAKEVCKVFGLPEGMLQDVLTSELGQKAKRPLQGGLKMDKVQKQISIQLVAYKQGLLHMRQQYE